MAHKMTRKKKQGQTINIRSFCNYAVGFLNNSSYYLKLREIHSALIYAEGNENNENSFFFFFGLFEDIIFETTSKEIQ